MYQPHQNCFRRDLVVVADTGAERTTQRYLIKNPTSGELFEFGPEEVYVCQLMDGELTATEIINKFEEKFQTQLHLPDFQFFASFLDRAGLLGIYPNGTSPPKPENTTVATQNLQQPSKNGQTENGHEKNGYAKNGYSSGQTGHGQNLIATFEAEGPATKDDTEVNPYRFVLFNPNSLFRRLAIIFRPLFVPIWFFLPGLTLAVLTLLYNLRDFYLDLNHLIQTFPFFQSLALGLLTINMGSKLVQGTAIALSGGRVDEFGIEITFGFFPLFFINKQGTKRLSKKSKLYIFAIPLIFRLGLFSLCILTWFSARATQSGLVTLALTLSQSSIIGLLIDISPFWKSNGYLWLTTYFNVYRLYDRAMQLGDMVIGNRPLPRNMSQKEKTILLVYIVSFSLIVGAIFIAICIPLSSYLEARLQGTGILLFGLLLALISRWYFTMNPPENKTQVAKTTSTIKPASAIVESGSGNITNGSYKAPSLSTKFLGFLDHHKFSIVGIVGLAIISALPYQYHPGGRITLLPPRQQEIQPDISGRIISVLTKGGDGSWLKKGTVIAQVEPSRQQNPATPIDDDLLLIQEQIKQQEANLEKQKARLSELLSTPREDEVTIARAQLSEAEAALEEEKQQYAVLQEELEVASQRLKVAEKEVAVAETSLTVEMTSTDFRERDSARQKELYVEGAVALQDFEDSERLAAVGRDEIVEAAKTVDVRRQEVEEQQQNVAARQQELAQQIQVIRTREQSVEAQRANLSLVLSGPHPDEIEAARDDVQVAEAQLNEKLEELKSTKKQLQRSDMVMPFDGRVVTSFLDQKKDTYIEQGEEFAIAEDDRNIRAELQIAETDVGQFDLGKTVTVKLAAYPNQTVEGKVISIEPTATEEENSRFVNVIVELPNLDSLLKSGMTGHAKVEGEVMPVIVVFTRPLVRFFQIEVWSWIP